MHEVVHSQLHGGITGLSIVREAQEPDFGLPNGNWQSTTKGSVLHQCFPRLRK